MYQVYECVRNANNQINESRIKFLLNADISGYTMRTPKARSAAIWLSCDSDCRISNVFIFCWCVFIKENWWLIIWESTTKYGLRNTLLNLVLIAYNLGHGTESLGELCSLTALTNITGSFNKHFQIDHLDWTSSIREPCWKIRFQVSGTRNFENKTFQYDIREPS